MNQLDSQLDDLASGTTAAELPAFPIELQNSLRRRRVGRRLRIGSVVLIPMVLISAIVWWPRVSDTSLQDETGLTKTIVRADPAAIPSGEAWQPVNIERAVDRRNLDLSGF